MRRPEKAWTAVPRETAPSKPSSSPFPFEKHLSPTRCDNVCSQGGIRETHARVRVVENSYRSRLRAPPPWADRSVFPSNLAQVASRHDTQGSKLLDRERRPDGSGGAQRERLQRRRFNRHGTQPSLALRHCGFRPDKGKNLIAGNRSRAGASTSCPRQCSAGRCRSRSHQPSPLRRTRSNRKKSDSPHANPIEPSLPPTARPMRAKDYSRWSAGGKISMKFFRGDDDCGGQGVSMSQTRRLG